MKQIITFMLLFATTISYSQNTLEGTVLDNDTKEGLDYVNVYLPSLEKGAVTKEKGVFKITDLPSGTHKIIFSMIGYETLSLNITIPNKEPLNISLKASVIEMEDVIISTPFHKLQSENVMKVEQKKVADLKANGSVTLSDGITNIAGVESISTGLSIGKPVIRGLSSNRVLVYTQGVRLENQQFGDEHGLGINDSGIESVEVIKGPASLLYGSDALGGVLYLNPEKFAQANTTQGEINANYFSNTLGYNTGASVKTSGDKFKFIFRGSLAEHSDYNTKEYRVTNTRFKEQDFKTGIGYQTKQFKSELRYNVNNSKLGIPEDIGEQSTNKAPLIPFQNITNHIFSSKSNVFFNNSSLDINLGYLYNDRKEFAEQALNDEDLEAELHLKLKTFNYDVKYNLPKLGKFETIVGTQGMHQVNTNYGPEELIPDATTNDIGFLAVSHIHLNKVDIQLGARYDNRLIDLASGISKNFNSFNGAAGAKINIVEKITARLNLATGFRAPNLAELTSDGIHEGTNRYEIGNFDLKNEQNFQTDLALEYKNDHIELFANGFYNKVNNYIFLSPNGDIIDTNPVFTYLQDDAMLYGGEFGFHFHPHPLDWLHFESSFETVTGKRTNDNYLPLIPANSLSNILRAELDNSWITKGYIFIKLKSTFSQDNISDFETNTPGYNLLSAGFGGTIQLLKKDLNINISGNNLTDQKYINHLSRLKADNIYNIGRNISLGFTYNL
jgi:iron complex outermembrane receptor protein